tara:strand:+ start:2408 stop:3187 length:780 start_codon:yes stop_codon:yes gene_type:complete
MFEKLGRFLSRYLEFERRKAQPYVSQDFDALRGALRVGDVLLVEGRAKISTGIKYLTQSTWSHAALCVVDERGGTPCELVEVTLADGCHRIPLTKYKDFNTRICRAAGLTDEDRAAVAAFAVSKIGLTYDTRNIIDLARYLLPFPPVPVRWRRRMLAFGSGDPTRAICSSLVAQAFQSVRYPILPTIRMIRASCPSRHQRREVWHIRHSSLFVPRDFDLSPYFAVIKPSIAHGVDYRRIPWAEPGQDEDQRGNSDENVG